MNMISILLLAQAAETAPNGDVSPVCWKLLSALAVALVAVVAWALTLLKKLDETQNARIADLKATNELADTLLDVLQKRPGGGL